MQRKLNLLILASLLILSPAWAQESKNKGVVTASSTIPPSQQQASVDKAAPEVLPPEVLQQVVASARLTPSEAEAMRYTLGPDDVISITVQRHPEFSGTFPINLEGKIQMQFAGDVDVTGLTKKELQDKVAKLVSTYVNNPEVDVTILEYRSKFYLVIGEVNRPGRYFMRSGTTTVKDAIIESGLPMVSAAMRKCVVITPDKNGRIKKRAVDVYAILYGGNLRKNVELRPGDTLYVPATVMAKAFRVIAPVTEPVTAAAGAQTGLTTFGAPNRTTPARTNY